MAKKKKVEIEADQPEIDLVMKKAELNKEFHSVHGWGISDIDKLYERWLETNWRIDRIVAAIDKSKSVKGL